ncbi:hypothetical protein COCNU_scaffold118084G000010 [Cocos nucifera]|nr:hypothetical protein [Cocos nucifera]
MPTKAILLQENFSWNQESKSKLPAKKNKLVLLRSKFKIPVTLKNKSGHRKTRNGKCGKSNNIHPLDKLDRNVIHDVGKRTYKQVINTIASNSVQASRTWIALR